jgi:hypothetical protein
VIFFLLAAGMLIIDPNLVKIFFRVEINKSEGDDIARVCDKFLNASAIISSLVIEIRNILRLGTCFESTRYQCQLAIADATNIGLGRCIKALGNWSPIHAFVVLHQQGLRRY